VERDDDEVDNEKEVYDPKLGVPPLEQGGDEIGDEIEMENIPGSPSLDRQRDSIEFSSRVNAPSVEIVSDNTSNQKGN